MSKEISVTFLHPTNGTHMPVGFDGNNTASTVINNLIAAKFIPDNPAGGYSLCVKGGSEIKADQMLAKCGITNGSVIRVVPATDAGC